MHRKGECRQGIGRRPRAPAVALVASLLITAGCGSAPGSLRDSNAEPPDVPISQVSGSPDGLVGTLIDHPPLPRPLQTLRDTTGRPFSLADRPDGEVTALFFGFTKCPDACPTAMADLASARTRLPAGIRERVQIVFVTEDPLRDSPRVLETWLEQFDPSIIGLIGGNTASKAMANALYLPEAAIRSTRPQPTADGTSGSIDEYPNPHEATDEKPRTSAGDMHTDHSHGTGAAEYSVDHSTAVYLFGPAGQTVLYSSGATADDYAADFLQLLNSQPGAAR